LFDGVGIVTLEEKGEADHGDLKRPSNQAGSNCEYILSLSVSGTQTEI
jgi:hypothetical protein